MSRDMLTGFVLGVGICIALVYFVLLLIDARITAVIKRQDETITDGWNYYPRWCGRCGAEIQIIRPGDARCPNGCFEVHG